MLRPMPASSPVPNSTAQNVARAAAGPGGDAPDLAAIAALLEIGENLGVLDRIAVGEPVRPAELAAMADLPTQGVAAYLEALEAAGLLEPAGLDGSYRAAPDFTTRRHQAGYLLWALSANRPYIDHAREFLTDRPTAMRQHPRDHERVAVSAAWMDSLAAYPAMLDAILDGKPGKVVDLGGGVCELLIEVLTRLPEARGVGVDTDSRATRTARENAARAGLGDRLTTVERSIQSLVDDPEPLDGADVVHAGFVLHDMFPEDESAVNGLMARCRERMRPGGRLIIAEIVPYLRSERERRFSAVISYLHGTFMGRVLVPEETWTEKLADAGFRDVRTAPLGYPAGRLFIATS